jgi:hypothetical protein
MIPADSRAKALTFLGRGVTALVGVSLAACHGDAVSGTDRPAVRERLIPLYGNHVNGESGPEAAESITVALLSDSGTPMPGMRINWSATNGGSVHEESASTDERGIARASWTFGDRDASQTASASFGASEVPFFGLLRQSPPIAVDSLFPLKLATFDGSGQVVHPDVVFLPRSWDGGNARLAMAITPYPYGDMRQENPSLFVSDGGPVWRTLQTAQNPVARPTAGYLSDPALLFDASSRQLRMYYRQVMNGDNVILLIATPDGLQWSRPREVIRVPSDGLISPTVVRRSATDWLMWSVNGGVSGCAAQATKVELRRSVDGVEWDAPTAVALDQPGGYAWHVDVKWIGPLHEYWALYNLKSPGNCVTPAVYLATSPDGLQWTTYPRPVLQRGAITAFADVVYRSSFVYTKADDMVTFYYSGARWDGAHYVWSGAIQRRSRRALFAGLQAAPTLRLLRPRRDLPNPEGAIDGPRRNR